MSRLGIDTVICLLFSALIGCVNPQANLDRLHAECAVAPFGVAATGLIPVPGVSTIAGLTVSEICAHPELVANDEAKFAAAIQALTNKP